MEIRLTLLPGMAGTKKLLARYGERLVCVRYRYDKATGRRVKTAELIVQDVAWAGAYARASPRTLCGIRRRTSIPCAVAAIGEKPDIQLREEMGADIG